MGGSSSKRLRKLNNLDESYFQNNKKGKSNYPPKPLLKTGNTTRNQIGKKKESPTNLINLQKKTKTKLTIKKENHDSNIDLGSFRTNSPSLFLFKHKKATLSKSEIIRKNYFSKLVNSQKWDPMKKVSRYNCIIIFDWDDTILPTSYLAPKGDYLEEIFLNDLERQQLRNIEEHAINLLNIAKSKGNVYIVTNAQQGWVEFTSKIFFPKLKCVLDTLKVISAREKYEKSYPSEVKKWKIRTFLDIREKYSKENITNIICIGDCNLEIEAAKIMADKFSFSCCKTVKFKKEPKPSDIAKQLELCTKRFERIYLTSDNTSVEVEKKE